MTSGGKGMPRKTPRVVRTPAVRLPHLKKKLVQIRDRHVGKLKKPSR